MCVTRPSRYLTASVDVQRKTELEEEIKVSITTFPSVDLSVCF